MWIYCDRDIVPARKQSRVLRARRQADSRPRQMLAMVGPLLSGFKLVPNRSRWDRTNGDDGETPRGDRGCSFLKRGDDIAVSRNTARAVSFSLFSRVAGDLSSVAFSTPDKFAFRIRVLLVKIQTKAQKLGNKCQIDNFSKKQSW